MKEIKFKWKDSVNPNHQRSHNEAHDRGLKEPLLPHSLHSTVGGGGLLCSPDELLSSFHLKHIENDVFMEHP
jgi:hypothetical protein